MLIVPTVHQTLSFSPRNFYFIFCPSKSKLTFVASSDRILSMASTSNGVNEGSSTDATNPNNSVQPSMTMHSVSYPPMPMHTVYAVNGLAPQQPLRSKRRQVKNACTNCQKACKKCDDARPCLRCVKYSVQEECVDSQRKERKKGVKRGPYKKRDGRGKCLILMYFTVRILTIFQYRSHRKQRRRAGPS